MAWYEMKGAGLPAGLQAGMDSVLNKKFGTSTTYAPATWPDNVNLLGPLPIKTASGAVAAFSDGADDVPCSSVLCNIVPAQAGTGTPSPSNPRAISGWTGLTVTHTDGQTPPVETETIPMSWQTEAGTVYGGTLELTTGVLTVTHALVAFSECTWASVTSYQSNFNSTNGIVSLRFGRNAMANAGYAQKVSTAYCNIFDNQSRSVWNNVNRLYEIGYSDGISFNVLYSDIGLSEWTSNATNTLNAFRASSIYANGYFALELATPTTYQLTPQQVNTFLADNAMWQDTGDISVSYRADISLALQALQNNRSLGLMMSRPDPEEPEEVTEPEEPEER